MGKLNKELNVPLYQWLMEIVQNQAFDGELEENDRIPTETELSREYGVSRVTVRKIAELLMEEEILVKCQGVRTSVSQKRFRRSINGFIGSTQSCLAEGNTARAQLVSAELAETTMMDTEELEIQEHEKTVKIAQVRTCDRIPAMLKKDHFPTHFIYLLGYDLTGSIYRILAENGTIMDNDIKRIGICRTNEIEHKHLSVGLDKPLLYVKDVNYGRRGDPVRNCRSVINPDYYKMTVVVNA